MSRVTVIKLRVAHARDCTTIPTKEADSCEWPISPRKSNRLRKIGVHEGKDSAGCGARSAVQVALLRRCHVANYTTQL
jgi:hypothetical protein